MIYPEEIRLARCIRDGAAWCVISGQFKHLQQTPEQITFLESHESAAQVAAFVTEAAMPLIEALCSIVEHAEHARLAAQEDPSPQARLKAEALREAGERAKDALRAACATGPVSLWQDGEDMRRAEDD